MIVFYPHVIIKCFLGFAAAAADLQLIVRLFRVFHVLNKEDGMEAHVGNVAPLMM